jgi:hypothetical protein
MTYPWRQSCWCTCDISSCCCSASPSMKLNTCTRLLDVRVTSAMLSVVLWSVVQQSHRLLRSTITIMNLQLSSCWCQSYYGS